MDLHSNDFQAEIKNNMINSYHEFIDELKNEIDLSHPYLDEYFSTTLAQEIQANKDISNYSAKKFYWLNQVEGLIYLIGLCEEYEESEAEYEKAEVEEEIFFFWDSSEHSKVFLDYLQEGSTTWEATQEMIPLLENQILAYYFVQVKAQYNGSHKLIYTVVPEIGESTIRLYLGEDNKIVDISSLKIKTFPSLLIEKIDSEVIVIEGEALEIQNSNETKINETLSLHPNCELGLEKKIEFAEKINSALDIIENFSPKCFLAFENFTKVIVPVNEKNVVSYSMQSLPEFSCLNTFDRDFVDLIDDLIHENGHHVLNSILNFQSLMNEDDDKIYYSPWRRALRPVRGIYHAVFTFYWALELFSNLFENLEQIEVLEEDEQNKIAFRVCEEFLMLSYCQVDIEHAFKLDKVTPEGKELIDVIFNMINEKSDTFDKAKEYLNQNSQNNFAEINSLSKLLEDNGKKYRK